MYVSVYFSFPLFIISSITHTHMYIIVCIHALIVHVHVTFSLYPSLSSPSPLLSSPLPPPSSLYLSGPWPRIVISVNPHSHSRQLVTTHSPPLEAELSLHPNKLSFQDMLVQCIRLRSMSILGQLQKVFSGTPWEDKGTVPSNDNYEVIVDKAAWAFNGRA